MSTATPVLAVDTAATTLAAVEHLVHEVDRALAGLLPEEHLVSTHLARVPEPHYVAVVDCHGADAAAVLDRMLGGVTALEPVGAAPGAALLASSPDLEPACRGAVDEHRTRRAGRLARYPGRAAIERAGIAAADVVAASVVEEVVGLAGVEVFPHSELDLTGFARPTWADGRCTLLVQPARGGVLVPFELPHQIACCSDH